MQEETNQEPVDDDETGCNGCRRLAEISRGHDDTRRRFVKSGGVLMALAASTRVSAAIEIPGADKDKNKEGGEELSLPPQIGDRLTYFSRTKRGSPIRVEDVPIVSKQMVTLPLDKEKGYVRDGSTYNQLIVQRFDNVDKMDKATAERADAADGIIVYSAICTHFGCIVSGWDKTKVGYMCPCHQSLFDPRSSGDIVHGPAPRRLPALPVTIEDGEIVVAGDFDAPVGIGKIVR